MLLDKSQLEERINTAIYLIIAHGLGDSLGGTDGNPIIGVPTVDQSHLETSLLSDVDVVVDENFLKHSFCFDFIVSVDPEKSRNRGV